MYNYHHNLPLNSTQYYVPLFITGGVYLIILFYVKRIIKNFQRFIKCQLMFLLITCGL